jgi:hypothetical protein
MDPEDVIEIFVSAIMVSVLGVVAIYILSPDIGEILISFLPSVVELLVYAFVVVFIFYLIYELVDSV